MKKTRFSWPLEYVQINNSRIALEAGHRASWLQGQLDSMRSEASAESTAEDLCKKEGEVIEEITTGILAAKLMAIIENDVENSAMGLNLSDAICQSVSKMLPDIWKSCRDLADCSSQPAPRRQYEALRDLCIAQTGTGKEGTFKPCPTNGNRHGFLCKNDGWLNTFFGHSLWTAAWCMLRELKLTAFAEQLLLDFWDHYAAIQKAFPSSSSSGESIYRSHASYLLAVHYFENGERASAARWALITFIHDVATGHFNEVSAIKWGATGAINFMFSHFGTSPLTLQRMYDRIKELEQDARYYDWVDCLFPEYVLALLMSELDPNSKHDYFPPELRQQRGNRAQHPLNPALLNTLWAKKASDFPDNTTKGNWLERLMAYLFSTIDGLRVRRSLQTDQQTSEIDLLVECLPHSVHWLSSRLGKRIIVECKHRKNPFSSNQLFEILGKMTYHQCDAGIVVSTSGYTGDGSRGTRGTIPLATHQGPSNRIILIHEQDLEHSIKGHNGPPHFLAFLLNLCESQLDRRAY